MNESMENSATEAMQVEKGDKVTEEKKAESEISSSHDSDSVCSTESDVSTTDDFETSEKTRDPELLLIKAANWKEEGNNYFKQKDYLQASRCYRKGTSTIKPLNKANTGDSQVKALLVSLQSNLSMMYFKLDKHKQSAAVATCVLKIEAKNVKALYRRAVANRKLGEYAKARDDLREALKYDSSNAAVRKELASLKQLIAKQNKTERDSMKFAFSNGGLLYDDKEEEKEKKKNQAEVAKKQAEAAKAKRKAEWEDECVRRMAKGEFALSFDEYEKQLREEEERKKKEENKKLEAERERRIKERELAKKSNDSDSDDELTEAEIAQLRGYKKTSDGRITSYFTREQSQEEKLLAAERNAPKRLDSGPQQSETATVAESGGAAQGKASAWNAAGTWEEKDTTEWCRDRLQQRLKETKSESELFCALITGVNDMTGDASVALVSGKKRYIFDFHCKIEYEIKSIATGNIVASGSMKLPDVCSTHHEELEVLIDGWKKSPKENSAATVECRERLVSDIRESVKLWVKDFNGAY